MKNNQIIAVWGNPSSGKTVTSIKIARELALRKKNVILMFCDTIAPDLMMVLPDKNTDEKSLGSLLSAPEITQEKILSKCITLDKNEYISLLGYSQGENSFTYAKYAKDRAVDLLILLRHIADYVVVDCSAFFISDLLSVTAIELADSVIRLSNCNLKALSYFNSSLPLLADRRFNTDKHIKVLSKVKADEPSELMAEKYNGVMHELPYIEEIAEQYLTGRLFGTLESKQSIKYTQTIQQIITSVLNENSEVKQEPKPAKTKKIKEAGASFLDKVLIGMRGGRS